MGQGERENNPFWLFLGRAVTIIIIPWMVWVSVSVMDLKTSVALLAQQSSSLNETIRDIEARLRVVERATIKGTDH